MFVIRQAVDNDLEDMFLMAIELQDHLETSNPKIWRLSKSGRESIKLEIAKALHDPNQMIVVAENREIVGMAIGQILKKKNMTIKVAGAINSIIVKKKWRSKGIGIKLVAALTKFLDDNGVEDITLRYVIGNKEAETFWEGLGFEPRIKIANIQPRKLNENLRKHIAVDDIQSPY